MDKRRTERGSRSGADRGPRTMTRAAPRAMKRAGLRTVARATPPTAVLRTVPRAPRVCRAMRPRHQVPLHHARLLRPTTTSTRGSERFAAALALLIA